MQKVFANLITSKISPKWIIKDHLATLVDGRGKRHIPDYITFFAMPIIPAVGFKMLGAELGYDIVGVINTGLALFAGLFLSVSIQLISIDKNKLTSESARKVQKQTISNISFLIFLSLFTILLSYLSLFEGIESDHVIIPYKWYKITIDVVVYWLTGVFLLTVLMVLKRTSILFEELSK